MVVAQESNVIRQWSWARRRKDRIGKCVEAIGFSDSLDCGENSKGKGGVEDDFRKPSEM